jgi:hypothetical protein
MTLIQKGTERDSFASYFQIHLSVGIRGNLSPELRWIYSMSKRLKTIYHDYGDFILVLF